MITQTVSLRFELSKTEFYKQKLNPYLWNSKEDSPHVREQQQRQQQRPHVRPVDIPRHQQEATHDNYASLTYNNANEYQGLTPPAYNPQQRLHVGPVAVIPHQQEAVYAMYNDYDGYDGFYG